MKKIFLIITLFIAFLNKTFADWWITWMSESKLRNWDFTYNDIPDIIVNATEIFLWIAWTISVIFIIIWAYKYLFGSLEWNTDKWKDTLVMAIIWFVISVSAYLIIKFVLDNFSK